ncbi:MAG: 2,3-bisphosphoglycerate-independent phosphoglycerate mutase [Defluviitaleaceae bacterium]|nr:2,3-bisphosphoglycerate-independent phosphoglycerate mutase [Defluviitaleaceae bacterium]
MKKHKPTLLMILDGYGLTDNKEANAIYLAKTPNLDKLWNDYPHAYGSASGLDVGLPEGQMGNSEVGHTNIGAGRVVYQELTRISKSIADGDFFQNEVLNEAIDLVKADSERSLHVMGLLSDGGVHSHEDHLYAILKLAKEKNVKNVFVHAFLDGRDTSPTSGVKYLENLQKALSENIGVLATVIGRYYSMDRDNREERTKEAYDALVNSIGEQVKDDFIEKVKAKYSEGITDEFIRPLVCGDSRIKNGDSVIFINFRPDRARQITRALTESLQLNFVCMTEYDPAIKNKKVAFTSQNLSNTLGELISKAGLAQLRMAETEKYPHVTFFFNGGLEEPFKGEDRIVVPSPKVATYDLQPEMNAPEVTEKLVSNIEANKYDFILINYANPDMVGHTGDLNAVIKAIEEVDRGVGLVYEAIKKIGGQLLICADHGNADKMIDYETKEPHTAHTTNPVPLMLVNTPYTELRNGRLCDIAPTVLKLLNLEQPKEMDGISLI